MLLRVKEKEREGKRERERGGISKDRVALLVKYCFVLKDEREKERERRDIL
jgi:hypothetical protein